MNVVVEVGRLTSDVEIKQTPSGVPVCSFTLAVYRTKEITDFLPCVAWRETVEHIARYFHKGQMIAVRGQLQSRKYEDKDKRRRTVIEIKVDSVSFCESAKAESGEGVQASPLPADPHFEEIGLDEDLPF